MGLDVFFYVVIAALANILGGLIIFIKKDWSKNALNALMAISAGMLLAIAILDLIPEVLEVHHEHAIYILAGIAIIFFFQQFVANHFHFGEETHKHSISSSAITGALIGMVIHTFFDGFSIVASFEIDFSLGITVLTAILLHKIPDGLTISSIVFSFLRDKKKAFMAATLLGLSTIAGAVVAAIVTPTSNNIDLGSIAVSFTAGIFIYVACADLLPEVNKSDNRFVSSFFLIGIFVYFLIKWIVDQSTFHSH
ncbi:ZIP family metal transporter [Bacillus carboniphilus]|uniref:ZIP family metal transporter n=1 Tax=Bacillus carboniphilus TaxID=86663 RepID=A0ABN0W7T1_9BACI